MPEVPLNNENNLRASMVAKGGVNTSQSDNKPMVKPTGQKPPTDVESVLDTQSIWILGTPEYMCVGIKRQWLRSRRR